MYTKLFWIDGPWKGKLAISARPRGGDWLEDEMRAWRREGVDAVVSLLTGSEDQDLGLQTERHESEANGIEFFSLPIVDRSTPAAEAEIAPFLIISFTTAERRRTVKQQHDQSVQVERGRRRHGQ